MVNFSKPDFRANETIEGRYKNLSFIFTFSKLDYENRRYYKQVS